MGAEELSYGFSECQEDGSVYGLSIGTRTGLHSGLLGYVMGF